MCLADPLHDENTKGNSDRPLARRGFLFRRKSRSKRDTTSSEGGSDRRLSMLERSASFFRRKSRTKHDDDNAKDASDRRGQPGSFIKRRSRTKQLEDPTTDADGDSRGNLPDQVDPKDGRTLLRKKPAPGDDNSDGFDRSATVFFMIGSQRSGSNWLRTMLSEREDLAGPHPPHILRDFMPILDKFGNLEDGDNLSILVDHVATFVECNQVTWLDKHGRKIRFDRERILDAALRTVANLRVVRKNDVIDQRFFLVAIFDEIYNINAIENGKRTWICKSMGNSQYHDLLLTYYGESRLRYIYLVRDPRDVALSFMQTPVGDCHYHAIAAKWTTLQGHAFRILSEDEALVHQIHYESLLLDNKKAMKELNDFMGKRTFGKLNRLGSIQMLKEVDNFRDDAKKGRGAQQAAVLSYQFQNLTRGESFRGQQFQKWQAQMSDDDIYMVESVAYDVMIRLGYEPSIVEVEKMQSIDEEGEEKKEECSSVGEPQKSDAIKARRRPRLGEVRSMKTTRKRPRLVFSESDLAEFKRLNEEGIKKMHADLAVENPEDLERRLRQASILKKEPVLLSTGATEVVGSEESDDESDSKGQDKHSPRSMFPYQWPKNAGSHGYLSTQEVTSRFDVLDERTISLDSEGLSVRFSGAIQRGYYPDDPDKACQDTFLPGVLNQEDGTHYFSIFDGHGPTGEECAQYARDEVIKQYNLARKTSASPSQSLAKAMQNINDNLISGEIDAKLSGTTAVTLLLEGRECHVANIGDSRAVIVSKGEDGALHTKPMTRDHTPYENDELARVQNAGGLVMSAEQYDKTVPIDEAWSCDNPPRVWSKEGKFPGCAFTRSVGDAVAETLGVVAEAEVTQHTIGEGDAMFIVGSDGIFRVISDQEAAIIASNCSDPSEACRALVGESYKRWIKKEERSDDICVIVGFIVKETISSLALQ